MNPCNVSRFLNGQNEFVTSGENIEKKKVNMAPRARDLLYDVLHLVRQRYRVGCIFFSFITETP